MSKTSRQRFWLRLRELGFTSYAEYLASDHWADLRRRYFASRLWKGACQGCKRRVHPIQLHHRTYRRLGHEWLADVVGVCRPCHELIHRVETAHPRWSLFRATKRTLRRA